MHKKRRQLNINLIINKIAGFLLLALFSNVFIYTALAQENVVLEPPLNAPEPETSVLDTVDAPREYLSEKIVSYSKSIDEFFGDKRYFQENNKSVIQLDFTELIEQSGNRNFSFDRQAKLDLPAASKRFQLVLEYNPEQKSTGEVNKDQPAVTKPVAAPDSYAASVRYEKVEESLWHFSTETGVKFQFPLDPFARARGRYSIPLQEWRLNLAETVFWFSTIGLGETTQIDMERVISKPLLFRATSTATCLENPQNCDLRQDLSIFHTLNERTALLYQASVIGNNQPELHETAYVLMLKYRYRLHKEWIFVEVLPQLNFPKSDDFRMNPSLLLRLELLFGGTK